MLSEFLSIAEKIDLAEITGLDMRCIQILLFLLMDVDDEYNHNQLKRELNNKGLPFQEPTFTRHLDHLEERKLITRIRNHTTTIKLNLEDIDQKLNIKKAIEISTEKLNIIKSDIKEYTISEIFEDLKTLYIEKGSASLLLKLRYINKSIPENEFHIGYLWVNLLYEFLIDGYIDEVKSRGAKAMAEILTLYFKT